MLIGRLYRLQLTAAPVARLRFVICKVRDTTKGIHRLQLPLIAVTTYCAARPLLGRSPLSLRYRGLLPRV